MTFILSVFGVETTSFAALVAVVGVVTGVVREIGLFATTLDQADDVRAVIGNNKIFADNIVNYSANPTRRVELVAQVAHDVDIDDAIARLRARVAAVPHVDAARGVEVELLEFNAAGAKLAVRPHTHNDHYWQVYFDTNKAIRAVGAEARWPVPAPQQVMLTRTA